MTEIEFHANVPERLHFGCRLLRKVVRSGTRSIVIADGATLVALDRMLWEFSLTEFVPHCMGNAPDQIRAVTPVMLVEQLMPVSGHQSGSILINLGQQIPAGFEQFERLIEIASVEADDRRAALGRWKHYKSRGYVLKTHDAAAGAGA
jgi:DNA polymerase III subunit chi